MSLRVSGKNINIGEALRTHVTDRLSALTGKYFDGGVTGHVTITPDGTGFRTECSLHLTSGMALQADGRAQDPYGSFDQSAERIEKRLRRYKSRLKSHHDHEAAKAETVASYILEAPDQEEDAPAEFTAAVIAEFDDAIAPALGVASRARPRSLGRPGAGVSTRLYGTSECGLSAAGSPHRLDRHAGELKARLLRSRCLRPKARRRKRPNSKGVNKNERRFRQSLAALIRT